MDRRHVVWFSCGAASAVVAKIAVQTLINVEVVYCDTSATEHPDNMRFLHDVEKWICQPILRIKSDKYVDAWDVWEKTRYLVGINGARCTVELKQGVRQKFQRDTDVHLFGYTIEECERAKRFEAHNLDLKCKWLLIDEGLTKDDCLGILWRAGVDIPAMYKMGYRNNNCIGCVKGQSGYWNKIRKDFPDVFERMAKMERKLDVAINKRYEGKTRIRVFLDELPPDAGNYADEPNISCGITCLSAMDGFEIEPISLPECAALAAKEE